MTDKPEVQSSISNPYAVIEGRNAYLVCEVTAANPDTDIWWKWIKTDSPNAVLHTGHNYTIPNIERSRSGTYRCTASNTVGTSNAVSVDVDVQCNSYIHSFLSLMYPTALSRTMEMRQHAF